MGIEEILSESCDCELLDFGSAFPIVAALLSPPGRASVDGLIERAVEDLLDPAPPLGRHARPSRARSPPRAIAPLPLIWWGVTPTASAVSSTRRGRRVAESTICACPDRMRRGG
jgi:hypothetical protein